MNIKKWLLMALEMMIHHGDKLRLFHSTNNVTKYWKQNIFEHLYGKTDSCIVDTSQNQKRDKAKGEKMH